MLRAVGQILLGFSLLRVDSGSFVDAVPKDFAPRYPLTPLEEDIEATVAWSQTALLWHANVVVFTFWWSKHTVDAFSMDVVRPILSRQLW